MIKKNRKKNIVIFIIVLYWVIAMLFIVFQLCIINSPRQVVSGLVFDTNAEDITQNTRVNNNISIPCFDRMVFNSGTTEQVVNFYNPKINDDINFKIYLYVNKELMYESNLIKPGKTIRKIEIVHYLEKQSTSAYIIYECYRKDGTKLNSARMNFNLEIK